MNDKTFGTPAIASAVPLLDRQTVDGSAGAERWMVVIYNNDSNSMEEVIEILMVATGCDVREAYTETWEADRFGKAPVHFAQRPECEQVAAVIGVIGVRTEVCQEWQD